MARRSPAILAAGLALAGILLAVTFVSTRGQRLHGAVLQEPRSLADVVLRSAAGPVRLADYRGKFVLMYFGYTSCPDVCPTTLAKLKAALNDLPGSLRDQVQVIFVSVDPERDNLQWLDRYAHVFGEDFIGASGTRVEIDSIAQSLGVYYKINAPTEDGTYTVDHSSQVYVVDKQGFLGMVWVNDTQPDEMLADLRYILRRGIPLSAGIFAGPTPTPLVCSLTLVPANVQAGQSLYEQHCALCHGGDLSGNPAAQTELEDGSRLPPPLDESGNAWRYSEWDFVGLVKAGRNLDKPIHMPSFKGRLTDSEIRYIWQYVANTWDVGQRNYHAGLLTLTPQPTWDPTPAPTGTLEP